MCILLDGARDGQVTAVDAATEMVPGALAPDLPPPDLVALALALNSAESLAHSILSRAVFLADAPAATLATPYALRRAGRQLATDSAALCRALDGIRAAILASLDAQAAVSRELGAALDHMGAALDAAELLDASDTESEGGAHAS